MTFAEALARFGSQTEAARALNIPRWTFRRRLKASPDSYIIDPALQSAMDAKGSELIPVNVWTRGTDAEGNKFTAHFKPDKAADNQEAVLDAIKAGLGDIPPAEVAEAPNSTAGDLAAIYPVADLHVGLLTDAEEVGQDWDTKISGAVFRQVFDRLLSVTPSAETAFIAQLGDLTHTDDQRNVTPKSKHQLDVDSRYFAILRRAVACMKYAIDRALEKHSNVIYRGCRGNHDETVHYAVTLALSEHYRNEPRVTIIDSANEFYVFEYGTSMVLVCHGDKTTPERLAMFAANEYPEMWGRTKHRRALTGHVHHQRSKEAGGLLVESIGTIIPRDAYAHSSGYTANRALVSIVIDRDQGEISRHRIAA